MTHLILHAPRSTRALRFGSAFLGLVVLSALVPFAAAAEDDAAIEARLKRDVDYLCSDELEGRGPYGKGLNLAAEYIAKEFRAAGLKTDLVDGKPFQSFRVVAASKLGDKNRLMLLGPAGPDGAASERVELGKTDFVALSLSAPGEFDLPMVFAGYGLTKPEEGYDDYAGLDCQGKMVVVLRGQPPRKQPADPTGDSTAEQGGYAPSPLRLKAENARAHGAAGVFFCASADEVRAKTAELRKAWQDVLDRIAEANNKIKGVENPSAEALEMARAEIDALLKTAEAESRKLHDQTDPLPSFHGAGGGDYFDRFTAVCGHRETVNRAMLYTQGGVLDQVEAKIAVEGKPCSCDLPGWRAQGCIDIVHTVVELKNVAAVCEGSGPAADETIVLGAHYDHIGRGEFGAVDGPNTGIHPGADDNASGTAVVMEVARQIAARPEKLRRRVAVVAFTGEEMGLYGSNYYVAHPIFPLDRTDAMFNLDMVGRLQDGKLTVAGTMSGSNFGSLLDGLAPVEGLIVDKTPGFPGPSDQLYFQSHHVPAIHFFSGMHGEYHRISDRVEKLNIAGMRRVAKEVEELIVATANAEGRVEYVGGSQRHKRPAEKK